MGLERREDYGMGVRSEVGCWTTVETGRSMWSRGPAMYLCRPVALRRIVPARSRLLTYTFACAQGQEEEEERKKREKGGKRQILELR